MNNNDNIKKIRESIFKEKKISAEINSLINKAENSKREEDKKMIESHIDKLRISLQQTNSELLNYLEQTNVPAPLTGNLNITANAKPEKKISGKEIEKAEKIPELDKTIIERLKKEKEKKVEKKEEKKTNTYANLSNKFFANISMSLVKQKKFRTIGRDLIKSNLNYTLVNYVSMLFLTTTIAFIGSFLIFLFFLFFNLSPTLPIITMATEGIGLRLLEIFWIPIIFPLGTFLFMYNYPSMERKSLGGKIDAELPFAAIHMSAIASSLVDPTKIFSIISSTNEYPNLEKEFNKLLNEINIYGYDLVTALKDSALNSPSAKLSELLNGLATTITSGGSLYEFFDKRSQSLLFEYRLDKEKNTKAAENFMDIYISVVIAAPMIFMLLLMMMKISGLGISLSTGLITLLVVGGVSLINIFFLVYLQLKQSSTA